MKLLASIFSEVVVNYLLFEFYYMTDCDNIN